VSGVRAHLQDILASEEFRRSPQSSAVLRYLVESALAKSAPKEYAVATEALGRPADFDPRTDPAVRVEVRRLRQKLLEYYAGAGRDASLAFDLPKGGYALTWRRRPQAAASTSIVVLPFANLSGDPSKEYFADGLTEELTSELARAADLRVVARTSALAFKGRTADVREIGRRLNVSTLVEGSVRWGDGRVRATVQLIDAGSGFHRWAHSYEAAEGDILGCQQELAIRIREALLLRVSPGDAEPPEAGPPTPEAYLQFLRARFHWNARTADGIAKALRLLEELAARYPGYAAPWAARAECYCVLGLDAPSKRTDYGELALACSERSLVLAPKLAEAHAARGWALGQYRFDHAAAEQHLTRAVELKPGYVMAHYVLSMAAGALRRFDDALRHAESAVTLDPLSMVAHRGVAYIWFARGDLDRAREHVLQALDLAPGAAFATYLHGLVEAEAGQTDLGLALLERAITQAGGSWPLIEGFMAYYQARAGLAAAAAATERRLAGLAPLNHMALALAAMGRGDTAGAIDQLDLAARVGDPFVVHIADHPPFPQLRREPRARDLYRRLSLPTGQP
jgi:adenylate cyclase